MGLELIIFIASILFGIFLYWRESNGNGIYRFINKLVNSKELQMKPENRKGFIFRQSFLPRLIFVVALFLIIAIVFQFVTPFEIFTSYDGLSAFSSSIVGTLIGTYVANFVIKSSDVIEEQSDSIGDIVSDSFEKGKDFIEDLTKNETIKEEKTETVKPESIKKEAPKKKEKSARDRLKDKGLM